ncbi:MAG: SDR family NAD(P)-dependent oxidoreductase, partial [Chloroflexi bacterium]|nr:SDR family NAD(P)-dependent oxidoreductase [Chloroflexota bacterium]
MTSNQRPATLRILITGGAGFIGSHLVDVLLSRGHLVRVLDNLSAGKRSNLPASQQRLAFVLGDVTDPAVVADCVRDAGTSFRVDVIVHLAALVSVPASFEGPIAAHQTNLVGTLNLLEAARKAGVRRFIYASSASVYGDTETLPIREDTPKKPLSPYAADKLAGEHYIQIYARQYGLTATAFRFFNVYGPRQDPRSPYSGVISIFMDRALKQQPVSIHGDGRQTRDFVYVADLVHILAQALETEHLEWTEYNLGSGRASTLLDVLDHLGTIVGREIERQYLPPRPGDVRHSVADIARLEASFPHQVTTPLARGLQQLLT